ncbi:BQ2448_2922 [Microbotryum intermedium]|uniref:Branched-chain-amino-acid aminotransferase n=1 Tax=Microbotryum intermedium TaxID=269621 RepID=A0A238FHG5_9BASI|nr:BQ2448_2922 [Microbotryum intermedium]
MTRLTPYLTRVLKANSARSTSLLNARPTALPLVASLKSSSSSSVSSSFSTSALAREKHAQTTSPPIVGSPVTGQDLMTGEVLAGADIDPSALEIELTSSPKTIPPSNELQFGQTFTDHMLTIPWNVQTGWGTPKISPYAPLQLDPSATVLHYAPTLFEGMKAYKDGKGLVRLFRPDKNMERMTRSAARLAFPDFTGDHLTTLIKKLVDVDSKWVPSEPGTSLYIRPTMIGTQAGLGVGASTDVLLFVIACPVGPYYSTGFKPVKLLATAKDVRAWPGGTGGYKLGSNYAAGVVPQQAAAALGYQQILWLYGPEHQLTEVGTMNLFVVLSHPDGTTELVTPPLEDMILPGVTRDSVLALARAHEKGEAVLQGLPPKFKVSERNLTMPQLREASKDGTLKEVFGSGTAAIVSPVSGIGYESELIDVPHGEDGLGDVARVMLREIVGRQTGKIESEWSVVV